MEPACKLFGFTSSLPFLSAFCSWTEPLAENHLPMQPACGRSQERTALLAGEVREQRLELRQREARVRSEWAVRAVLTPSLHGIFEICSGNKNISKC